MFSIPCILFAGGKSSRMGQDKSLLPFGGFPTLAEFQYRRLVSWFEHVYISAKHPDKFDFDPQVIEDPIDAPYAPTAGFVSAFQALDAEKIMVLSVDTPFIEKSVFQSLIDASGDNFDAVIAKTSTGSHPLCGIYRRTLLSEFERMLREGDHRLGKLLNASNTLYLPFDDEAPFANLNHPDEYEEAVSCYNNKKDKELV